MELTGRVEKWRRLRSSRFELGTSTNRLRREGVTPLQQIMHDHTPSSIVEPMRNRWDAASTSVSQHSLQRSHMVKWRLSIPGSTSTQHRTPSPSSSLQQTLFPAVQNHSYLRARTMICRDRHVACDQLHRGGNSSLCESRCHLRAVFSGHLLPNRYHADGLISAGLDFCYRANIGVGEGWIVSQPFLHTRSTRNTMIK